MPKMTHSPNILPLRKPSKEHGGSSGGLPSWDLSDLYPAQDAEEVTRDLAWAEKEIKAFAADHKGKLAAMLGEAKGADKLASGLARLEKLSSTLNRLGSFAFLQFAADTSQPEIVKFRGDIEEKLTLLSSDLVFFELELNSLEEALIQSALDQNPALARFRPYFRDLRYDKPFQLSEEAERLFQEKSVTGTGAWNRLFDETMADLKFEVAGEPEPLGMEATLHLFLHPDRAKRQAAAEAVSASLEKSQKLLTFIMNVITKDAEISHRWRKYPDLAGGMHNANRVEPEVVAALTNAVREHYPKIAHRYYKLKAGWMGMDKLSHWDRNAPLPDAPEDKIAWTDAKDIVLKAYGDFAPDMAEIAGRFFDKKWIDAADREGKMPGAFSASTSPDVHPYVLMNYQGSERDVMTLAHELGHGVHQVLASEQGALMAGTPLTLAETASVFGEMLTFQSLQRKTEDPKRRRLMLARKVEDMINTVIRQIAFYQFERKVHEARRSGELSTEQINALWMSVQGESLGDYVKLEPGYEIYWAYVPHFIHSPFYVYSYAFGDCLVNALYGLYQDGSPDFVAKYFALLKAGGTRSHVEALAPFGLDARDPTFWNKGLGVISGMIDELEALE